MSTISPEREGGEGAPLPQSQSARLSEQEAQLVARLLSDPTYFPIEFRTWLKQYIEGSGITLPASQIKGGGAGDRTGLPAGIILSYPIAGLPPDCHLCDGTALSRTDFSKLFAVIGVTWGAGDGTTTFNIPDLRDRALYGIGSQIGVAETDGVAAGSRGGPYHHHYFGQTTDGAGDHSHGVSVSGSTDGVGNHLHYSRDAGTTPFALATGVTAALGSGGTSRYIVTNVQGGTSDAGAHSHGVSASGGTDSDGDHTHWVDGDTSGGYSDKPSYAGIAYCITTGR